MPAVSAARWESAEIIDRVFRTNAYSDILIHELFRQKQIQVKDRALITELVFGTIRWKRKLDFYLQESYTGSWRKVPNMVKIILELGLYQLMYLDKIPVFAVINESVEHVKVTSGRHWSGTVNAILRRFASGDKPVRFPAVWNEPERISVEWSHPEWIINRWILQIGIRRTEQLCRINNERPLLSLRVNQCRARTELVVQELNDLGYSAERSRFSEHFIRITGNHGIFETSLFKNGWITVQDVSAGFAAALVTPGPGETILDMAAAPGGKTGYLAEISQNRASIIAMDPHYGRINRLQNTIERLGHQVNIIQADGQDCPFKSIDKILVDAPCSGLGVLKKRAELRWKISEEDIKKLTAVQKTLLRSAVNTLKTGGVIVYSTCTTTEEENQQMIAWFLKEFPEFSIEPAGKWISSEVVTGHGWVETWPDLHQTDGSFACRLKHNGAK